MALLSNKFPEMTDEQARQFVRHWGGNTVMYWHAGVGDYVASRYCSIAFFLDCSGLEDTPKNRDEVAHAMAYQGKATATDPHGRDVAIYY